MKITLIGLGAEEGDLSVKADEALRGATKILLTANLWDIVGF